MFYCIGSEHRDHLLFILNAIRNVKIKQQRSLLKQINFIQSNKTFEVKISTNNVTTISMASRTTVGYSGRSG